MIRLLNRALDFHGLLEIPGEQNNPTIMSFFKEIGYTWVQGDETAWCSAFVNYIAKTEGYEYSGKLDARSWLNIIVPIPVPIRGCLVILWRESIDSWKGHVGWYINNVPDAPGLINVYGGNQSNMCQTSSYPVDGSYYGLLRYGILKQRR